jgi:hypothetical protein
MSIDSALQDQENKQPALAEPNRTRCSMMAFCGSESFEYRKELSPEVNDGRVEFTFTPRGFFPIRSIFNFYGHPLNDAPGFEG